MNTINTIVIQLTRMFSVLLFVLVSTVASSQSLSFRLMSFNIQQPFGTNWEGRRDNAASIINNEQPDVIGTQEAVNYQRDYLIAQTNGYAWFGAGRDGGDSGEGSWVFYKTNKYTLDVSNSGSFWLSATPTVPSRFGGSYNRICTYVRLIDNTTGQGFYVFNAHFPTPDLSTARMQSMRLMADRMSTRSIQTDPVYLTGDFNSNEQDAVTIWMKSGSDNPIPCRDTYRDVDPFGSVTTGFGTKFDYIYCPNASEYVSNNSWVVTSPAGASDHMPIVADLTYGTAPVVVHSIPGKIEAELYSSMNGVLLEATTDTGGGQNVGFLDVGDWMSYNVDVATDGPYSLTLRSAGQSTAGQVQLIVDNVPVKTVDLPVTGGWQTWGATASIVDLTAGTHTLKIEVLASGFNLNWIEFTEGIGGNNPVKVISVNLWRKSNNWSNRMANIVSLFNGEIPDVAGIQEGDEGKQAELAAVLTDYTLETGPWNDQSTGTLYNSAKVKVIETGTFGYSSQPDNQSFSDWGDGAANGWLRVCNWVLFEQISTGKRFYTYNNHLDANGFTPDAADWRSLEVRLLADRIAARTHPEHPFIVIGDLNGVEQEEAIQYLKTGTGNPVPMVDTYREILPNGPGDSFGSVKYDYILVANDGSSQTVDAGIIYHSTYGNTSDHQQVVAVIQFLGTGQQAPTINTISHSPLNPLPLEAIMIDAVVTDDNSISAVSLSWGTSPSNLLNTLTMIGAGDSYSAQILGQVNGTVVYYVITGEDNDGLISSSSVQSVMVSDGASRLLADYDIVDLNFSGFGGSDFSEVTNPSTSGINGSLQVGSTTQGSEPWAGVYSDNVPSVDFTQTPIFKMKVYGPKMGSVLVKFEDATDNTSFFELSTNLTVTNAWTELSIDFSNAPSGVYEKVVLFFDNGNGTEDTYLFDDIRLEAIVTGEEGVFNPELKLTPNPTVGEVYLSVEVDWKVYSVNGLNVLSGYGTEIDMEDMIAGIYFVRIGGEVHRIIKQ